MPCALGKHVILFHEQNGREAFRYITGVRTEFKE